MHEALQNATMLLFKKPIIPAMPCFRILRQQLACHVPVGTLYRTCRFGQVPNVWQWCGNLQLGPAVQWTAGHGMAAVLELQPSWGCSMGVQQAV